MIEVFTRKWRACVSPNAVATTGAASDVCVALIPRYKAFGGRVLNE